MRSRGFSGLGWPSSGLHLAFMMKLVTAASLTVRCPRVSQPQYDLEACRAYINTKIKNKFRIMYYIDKFFKGRFSSEGAGKIWNLRSYEPNTVPDFSFL